EVILSSDMPDYSRQAMDTALKTNSDSATSRTGAVEPTFAPLGVRPLARPLGELLMEMGCVTVEALAEGLQAQHLESERIGETLVRLKHCSEWDLARGLARQFGLPARELVDISDIQDELVEQLPIQYARANLVLPYELDRN